MAEQLSREFADADVAVLLADRDARILGRWAGPRILAALDDICARPGYVFDETTVGTSALGTAVEDCAPVVVLGTEHFMDSFDALCAAGAPIRHPVTGRLEGALDIVCPAGSPVTFMLPLISRAAREVQANLLAGHGAADRALLDGLLHSDRRGTRRPSIALNKRLLIANSLAGDLLPSGIGMHSALWEQVERSLHDGSATVVVADGPDSTTHGHIRPIQAADGSLAAIVHLHRQAHAENSQPAACARPSPSIASAELDAALPGRSNTWRRVLRLAARTELGDRLLLSGPAGAGKTVLAQHVARDVLAAPAREWDARADPLEALRPPSPDDATVLIMRHLDSVPEHDRHLLLHRLDGMIESVTLIGTYCADAKRGPGPALSARFTDTVDVPALDDHREDIPDIVAMILRAAETRQTVGVTPEALQDLMRRDWPDNVRQLRRVLLTALRRSGTYNIRRSDLPAGPLPAAPRRRLSALQRAEQDAVRSALVATDWNKNAAAAALGISRSTLYRKIATLGLGD